LCASFLCQALRSEGLTPILIETGVGICRIHQ
jgi:hypothetical protein